MIVGNDRELHVSPADDGFHPPTSDDPTWIETVWFPEEGRLFRSREGDRAVRRLLRV